MCGLSFIAYLIHLSFKYFIVRFGFAQFSSNFDHFDWEINAGLHNHQIVHAFVIPMVLSYETRRLSVFVHNCYVTIVFNQRLETKQKKTNLWHIFNFKNEKIQKKKNKALKHTHKQSRWPYLAARWAAVFPFESVRSIDSWFLYISLSINFKISFSPCLAAKWMQERWWYDVSCCWTSISIRFVLLKSHLTTSICPCLTNTE